MQPVVKNSKGQETLLIAGASVRWLAQSAQRAGLNFVAADLFGDLDTRSAGPTVKLNGFEHLLQVVQQVKPDHLMICGGLEHHLDLLKDISRFTTILGSHPDVLKTTKNPWTLARVLDWRFPKCIPQLDSTHNPTHWLTKTFQSTGGRGVSIAQHEVNPHRTKQSKGRYLQRRLPGNSFGANYLAGNDMTMFLGAYEQLNTLPAHPFWYTGSLGPLQLPAAHLKDLELIGRIVCESFQLSGLFGIDFIITPDDQLFVIEINPRATASAELVDRQLSLEGESLVQWHLDACLGIKERNGRASFKHRFWCKEIIYWQPPVDPAPALQISERLLSTWRQISKLSGWEIADIPAAGITIQPGDPIMTLIAESGDVTSLRQSITLGRLQVLDVAESPDRL